MSCASAAPGASAEDGPDVEAPTPRFDQVADQAAPCTSSMLTTAARRPGQRNSSALACQ
jgi:hypothetical protein